jgi:integrase
MRTEPIDDFSAAKQLAKDNFYAALDNRASVDKAVTYSRMSEALIVYLQLMTGYRIGDLLARATHASINEKTIVRAGKMVQEPHLQLLEQKTEKRIKPERAVPIDAQTLKMLRQHTEFLVNGWPDIKLLGKGAIDSLPIFYNPKTGKEFTRQWIDQRLRGGMYRKTKLGNSLRELTTGRRVSTHSLRKSYALRIYTHTGGNIVFTSKALGHKSIETTKLYLNSADADMIDVHLQALK